MPNTLMTSENTLTIVLADDHELIREAVKPYLRKLAQNVDIREASTYDEVCGICTPEGGGRDIVDLALIDLDMPGYESAHPLKKLAEVTRALGNTRIVVFSASDDPSTISAALKCGARGFVPKSMRGQTLVNALRMVLWGEIYVPPQITSGGDLDSAGPSAEITSRLDASEPKLSQREADCLRFLVRGMTNKEIAREIGLQEVTVKMHLRNAYRKIGAANRIEAVRIAIESNFS